MDCKTCKELRAQPSVPYVAHESAMARSERSAKRLWFVIILLIVLLVGTNGAWLYYESQFETVSTTEIDAEQDGDGVNIVGGGDVEYGAESTHQKDH